MISHNEKYKELLRNLIISSQYLNTRSNKDIDELVSDICGLQYDPNPTIQLNQYIMLWNRKKNFSIQEFDKAAYEDFSILEAIAFKRNLFFLPYDEREIYYEATKGIVRWGTSEEAQELRANNPDDQYAENMLREKLSTLPAMTAKKIWEQLGLLDDWTAYLKRDRTNIKHLNLLFFYAFSRLIRRSEILTCGRVPGTFREPLYILGRNLKKDEWPRQGYDVKSARNYIVAKLIAAFGVTEPVHISHITGMPTAEIKPIFSELLDNKSIVALPYKISSKIFFATKNSFNKLVNNEYSKEEFEVDEEIKLVSPMDTIVRDKKWLETFFDYSFSFEYFKKKGMKWPLSILAGNEFIGYLDCKMEWKTGRFIIKEKNIFRADFKNYAGIDLAVEKLAEFHSAREIVEKG